MGFIRVLLASMRLQHKDYFFKKSIYLSLAIWPIIGFITTYYSYKPFSRMTLLKRVGLNSEGDIYVFLLIGFIAMMCFYTFIQSAWQSSNSLRISGALELLYLSPASRMAVLLGNSMASLFGSMWIIIIFAIGTLLLFPESITFSIATFALSLLLLFVTATCWGVFLHSLFLSSRDSGFLYTIFQDPVQMFTGAKIPFEFMPLWAKVIGGGLPLTYVITVLRGFLMKGASIYDLRFEIGWSLLISGLLLIAAHFIAILSERNAKIHGSATLF